MARFALLRADNGGFWCLWAARWAPHCFPQVLLLLRVVPHRINARAAPWELPGFRSTSKEIGFGKLKKVAWAGASWPGHAGALSPATRCLLVLSPDTKPSHFIGGIELTPFPCAAAHTFPCVQPCLPAP